MTNASVKYILQKISATPCKRQMSVMADLCLTPLVITALNVLVGFLSAAANADLRGNVFETQVGESVNIGI